MSEQRMQIALQTEYVVTKLTDIRKYYLCMNFKVTSEFSNLQRLKQKVLHN